MVFSLGRSVGRRVFAKGLPGGLRTFTTSFCEESNVLGRCAEGFALGIIVFGGYKLATHSQKKEAEARSRERYFQVFEEARAKRVEELTAEWNEKTLGVIAASPKEVTRVDGSVNEAAPMQG